MSNYAAGIAEIREARARIKDRIHLTPVFTSETVNRMAGRQVFFKCENLQKGGAFKIRGATNAILKLGVERARKGIVTHSSGNHAQAVALAARALGVDAHIVMPENAPAVKRRAVEEYGARVYPCVPTLEARETTADRVLEQTGGTFIPPYNHPDVIAGQASIALELAEQVPELSAIVAPVGGGGMLAGISLAAQHVLPETLVFGAEPHGADDAARSKSTGERVLQHVPDTIADGLLTTLGELTWPVIRDLVRTIFTVSDAETVEAMRLLFERMKLVVEPSAAVPLAVILSPAFRDLPGLERVAVVLSGGNVDLEKLPW